MAKGYPQQKPQQRRDSFQNQRRVGPRPRQIARQAVKHLPKLTTVFRRHPIVQAFEIGWRFGKWIKPFLKDFAFHRQYPGYRRMLKCYFSGEIYTTSSGLTSCSSSSAYSVPVGTLANPSNFWLWQDLGPSSPGARFGVVAEWWQLAPGAVAPTQPTKIPAFQWTPPLEIPQLPVWAKPMNRPITRPYDEPAPPYKVVPYRKPDTEAPPRERTEFGNKIPREIPSTESPADLPWVIIGGRPAWQLSPLTPAQVRITTGPVPSPRPRIPASTPSLAPRPATPPTRGFASPDQVIFERTYPQNFPTPRAPARGHKESKKVGSIAARSLLGKLLNAVTEGDDALTAIWKAIPAKHRTYTDKQRAQFRQSVRLFRPSPQTPQQMLKDVYKHFDKIDWDKAVSNLVQNHFSDKVIGRLGKGAGKFSRSVGSIKGVQSGYTL